MKLKALKDQRATLIGKLEEMVAGIEVQGEVRALTVEEKASFDEIKGQVENIDVTISVIEETRAKSIGAPAVKELKEERNKEEMENRALDTFLRGQDLVGEERSILAAANTALIPSEISKTILKKLEEACPVLEMAKRFSTKGTLRLIKEATYGNAGLTGENTEFANADVTFENVELRAFKVSAQVQASFEMLQNSDIDLSGYLMDVIVRRLSKELNKMFVAGTGSNQPQGLLRGTNKMTIASAKALTITDFIQLQTGVHPQYLDKAAWIVNRKTFQQMASLLDGNGRPYLVANVINDKVQYNLLGLPVIVDVNVPEMGASATPVILANIEEAYAVNILTDITVRHLVETGFTQGMETYAGYVMADGKIINEDAILIAQCPSA